MDPRWVDDFLVFEKLVKTQRFCLKLAALENYFLQKYPVIMRRAKGLPDDDSDDGFN